MAWSRVFQKCIIFQFLENFILVFKYPSRVKIQVPPFFNKLFLFEKQHFRIQQITEICETFPFVSDKRVWSCSLT